MPSGHTQGSISALHTSPCDPLHTQALWKKSNVILVAGCWCQFVILFPPLCEYLLEFRPRIFRQNYFSQLKYGALTSNGISNRCSVSLPPLSSSSSSSCITNSKSPYTWRAAPLAFFGMVLGGMMNYTKWHIWQYLPTHLFMHQNIFAGALHTCQPFEGLLFFLKAKKYNHEM